MKILLVHPRLSVKGGGERVAIHSILAATKIHADVSLVAEEFDIGSFEDFYGCTGLFDKVKKLFYPSFKPFLDNRALLYQRLIYHWFQIKETLSKQKGFDVVLSTQDIGYVPTTKAPVAQYCYFPEYFAHLETSPSSPMWRFYYRPASLFYRNRVRHVRTMLSVSDFTRHFVMKRWGRNSTTVYPPCPTETYSGLGSLEGRENMVVSVGRLVPEKRFDLFIELARLLPKTMFVAIGSVSDQGSSYYQKLRSAAPENVSFILSPLRKVKETLGRAAVYVHCAENEHFGITIVEAMAAGCVPVVHDSGGPREIVTEEVGYRWRSLRVAAAQISQLEKDGQLRRRLSSAATVRAKLFSPDVFESKMMECFEELGTRRF